MFLLKKNMKYFFALHLLHNKVWLYDGILNCRWNCSFVIYWEQFFILTLIWQLQFLKAEEIINNLSTPVSLLQQFLLSIFNMFIHWQIFTCLWWFFSYKSKKYYGLNNLFPKYFHLSIPVYCIEIGA